MGGRCGSIGWISGKSMNENQMKKKRKGRLRAPRQDIPWFPRIDAELCNSCLSCYEFCPKDVFASAKSEEGLRRRPKMEVVNPYSCIVMCSACEKICAAGAISFPPKEDFEQYVEYYD